MRARSLVFGTLGLLYLAGVGYIAYGKARDGLPWERAGAGEFRTRRGFVAGHQLRDDDIRSPDSLADRIPLPSPDSALHRHVMSQYRNGQSIPESTLVRVPALAPPTRQRATVVISLTAGELPLADVLEPGSWLRVCAVPAGQNTRWSCYRRLLAVDAVHRDPPPATSAWIAAVVPAEALNDITAYVASDKRILVIVADP